MIKLVFASDSFKGSLSCQEINEILLLKAKEVFSECQIVPLLISDGGEGAIEAFISYKGGEIKFENVLDPLFRPIKAKYGASNGTAIIAMSEASGLPILNAQERNPLKTTTYGTGELIKKAVEEGYKDIYVTIGGSATNDGGIGAMTALGVKFIKKDGTVCRGVGEELIEIEDIDDSEIAKYKNVKFTVLCDVTNPLTGETGATRVFSKQKGATKEISDFLEKGMKNYASVLDKKYGVKSEEIVGGGAAGGLGVALKVFLSAHMKSGISTMLELADFDNAIEGATCVITGEGRIDYQSADGKVISGILEHTSKKGIPTFAIVGSVGRGADKLYQKGISGIYSIIDKPDNLENILNESKDLYAKTAESLFRTIKTIKKSKGENI